MNLITRYYALLDGHEGAYGVVFPDLPGACAMGETVEIAMNSALEVMYEWLSDAAKNEGIPKPRSYEELIKDKDVQEHLSFGSVFVLVDSNYLPLPMSMFSELVNKSNLLEIPRNIYIENALRNEMQRVAS